MTEPTIKNIRLLDPLHEIVAILLFYEGYLGFFFFKQLKNSVISNILL